MGGRLRYCCCVLCCWNTRVGLYARVFQQQRTRRQKRQTWTVDGLPRRTKNMIASENDVDIFDPLSGTPTTSASPCCAALSSRLPAVTFCYLAVHSSAIRYPLNHYGTPAPAAHHLHIHLIHRMKATTPVSLALHQTTFFRPRSSKTSHAHCGQFRACLKTIVVDCVIWLLADGHR
jgi:hypothetical protein